MDELDSPRGRYLLRFFDSKMRNADKVEKYVKNGVEVTVALKKESMGYHSKYKPVPVLYFKVIKNNNIEVRKFTGKNIDKALKKLREVAERVY